jgi:hypothetical protein
MVIQSSDPLWRASSHEQRRLCSFATEVRVVRAQKRVRKVLEGLQHRQIDRSEFTEDAHDYFDAQTLDNYANSLDPLEHDRQHECVFAHRTRRNDLLQLHRTVQGRHHLD